MTWGWYTIRSIYLFQSYQFSQNQSTFVNENHKNPLGHFCVFESSYHNEWSVLAVPSWCDGLKFRVLGLRHDIKVDMTRITYSYLLMFRYINFKNTSNSWNRFFVMQVYYSSGGQGFPKIINHSAVKFLNFWIAPW